MVFSYFNISNEIIDIVAGVMPSRRAASPNVSGLAWLSFSVASVESPKIFSYFRLFGIGFSLFVVGIAALNLVVDFDFIEEGAEQGLPKHMEWYGAFSLMVTLVWLYIEILRLLMKLRSR